VNAIVDLLKEERIEEKEAIIKKTIGAEANINAK
jgi:hypothetical protein